MLMLVLMPCQSTRTPSLCRARPLILMQNHQWIRRHPRNALSRRASHSRHRARTRTRALRLNPQLRLAFLQWQAVALLRTLTLAVDSASLPRNTVPSYNVNEVCSCSNRQMKWTCSANLQRLYLRAIEQRPT